MNEVFTYAFADKNVRILMIDENPWFAGKDVAVILGYSNPQKAIRDHVYEDDRTVNESFTVHGTALTLINESGLYALIFGSKLPSAVKFKNWVTSEVLPSIRKHGAYMTPEKVQEAILNPDVMIQILQNLKAEQEKNKQLQEKNQNLLAENQALSEEAKIWDSRAVLNALIRAYAHRCCNDNYGIAWDKYYKELRYKLHINLKIRQVKSKKSVGMLDTLKEGEYADSIKLAVAICRENGIEPGEIINKVNAERYSEVCNG